MNLNTCLVQLDMAAFLICVKRPLQAPTMPFKPPLGTFYHLCLENAV